MDDNFDDNTLNPQLWIRSIFPTGAASVEETNQRLHLTNQPGVGLVYGGAHTRCKVSGDFDVRVDFHSSPSGEANGGAT